MKQETRTLVTVRYTKWNGGIAILTDDILTNDDIRGALERGIAIENSTIEYHPKTFEPMKDLDETYYLTRKVLATSVVSTRQVPKMGMYIAPEPKSMEKPVTEA